MFPKHSSELITALNKIQTVLNAVVKPALDGLIALVLGLAILATLVYLQPIATITAAATLVLSYFRDCLERQTAAAGQWKDDCRGSDTAYAQHPGGVGGNTRHPSSDRQDRVASTFAGVDRKLRDAQARNTILNQLPQQLIQALGMVLIIGFAWLLSRQGSGLGNALPMLGALALGAQRLFPMLQKLTRRGLD